MVATALVASAVLPVVASAQALNFPSFQKPRISSREYNFGVIGGSGTSLLFQWREPRSMRNQLSLDAAFTQPDGPNAKGIFSLGGQFGHQLTTARADMPLDMLLTAGANASFANGANMYRVPVGVSLGHRFQLDGAMAITPYVHPRLSFDYLTAGSVSSSDVNMNLDLGGDLELSQQLALRLSAQVVGPYQNSVGMSLAWTPGAVRTKR
jgi:hypothetical protein